MNSGKRGARLHGGDTWGVCQLKNWDKEPHIWWRVKGGSSNDPISTSKKWGKLSVAEPPKVSVEIGALHKPNLGRL